ncbi:MAG: hypothetical protein CL698_00385 [Chloroflexi bacterium]|nr:hypothetical protein [Chloroflexota bacterium]
MADRKNTQSWIRSTFDKSRYELINDKYNSQLLALLDLENSEPSFKQINNVTAKLQDKTLCRYQAMLLQIYCNEPQRYLRLDCDQITLTVRCSIKDIDSLLKPIGAKNRPRIYKAGTAAKPADFTVFSTSTYELNGGGSRPIYGKPFYSHGFEFRFYGDNYKSLFLYLEGNEKESGKYSLRISFNPNKLTRDEIKQALIHIQKRIGGEYRYTQLFSKAKVTRIDFGILLPGVSSAFVQAFRDNTKSLKSHCIPLNGQQVVETTYLGSKSNASHCIVYEKLLKESKCYSEVKTVIDSLAVTTRIEVRHLLYKERHDLDVKKMPEFPSRLKQVRIISPRHFHLLNNEMLQELLTDKRQESVKIMRKSIRSELIKSRKRLRVHKIDQRWLEEEQITVANSLMSLIINPNS